MTRPSLTIRRGALLLLLALALAAAWWTRPRPMPGVVLITVDTLRADRLGCYGSRTTETPHIDRFASGGLLFERAVAPLPETRPAHITIFTSRYPREHGVLSNAASFSGEQTTLAAVFRSAGYATAALAACSLFSPAASATLGFEHATAPDGQQERGADVVVSEALAWLEGLEAKSPFFLWLHLFDPHMPYEPPAPFDRPAEGAFAAAHWDPLLELARANGGDLPRVALERARELYDGEVEYVDHWLGRFFDGLATMGLYDETVIALTSDHGECFENGVFFEHSQCLGEGAIAAPLVVRYPPRLEPGRSTVPVEHTDIAPTLLRLAGLPVPADFGGRGLLERRADEDAYVFFQHPVYPRWEALQRRQWFGDLRSVGGEAVLEFTSSHLEVGARRGPFKYRKSRDGEALFHLETDPDERIDRADQYPKELEELRRAVGRWRREHPMETRFTNDLDPELLEQLRALGYL